VFSYGVTRAKTSKSKNKQKNENESYGLMVLRLIYEFFLFCGMYYVGGLGFWLMRFFLRIHFLISQTLIGNFVMESASSTVLVLLLPIGKVGWESSTLFPPCFLF